MQSLTFGRDAGDQNSWVGLQKLKQIPEIVLVMSWLVLWAEQSVSCYCVPVTARRRRRKPVRIPTPHSLTRPTEWSRWVTSSLWLKTTSRPEVCLMMSGLLWNIVGSDSLWNGHRYDVPELIRSSCVTHASPAGAHQSLQGCELIIQSDLCPERPEIYQRFRTVLGLLCPAQFIRWVTRMIIVSCSSGARLLLPHCPNLLVHVYIC